MSKAITVSFWFIIFSLISVTGINANSLYSLSLTEQEHEWIKRHPVILAAPDPDFPPVEYFNDQGVYSGLAADYIKIIERETGIHFKIIQLPNWAHVLNKARNKKIDLVTVAAETPQRAEYLAFTKPFFVLPTVIIVRQQVRQNLTMQNLTGMKVALVNDYAAHDYIKNHYPDLNLDPVPNIQTGLRKVSFGMVDAMIGNIATVSYYIEKGTITNLRVAGSTNFSYNLSFAPRKGHPELKSIIDKVLNQIPEKEKHAISKKWIVLEQDHLFNNKNIWGIVALVIGIVLILLSANFIWNRLLRKLVEKRTEELQLEISHHQKSKQAILESETRYRGVFEYTKSGVAVYKAINNAEDFILLELNRAGEKIESLKRDDCVGERISILFPAIKNFDLFKVIKRVWHSSQSEHIPATWYKGKRISGWREYFIYKLPTDEIVTIYSEETIRKKAENALKDSEEKLSAIVNSIADSMIMLDESLTIIWANHVAPQVFGKDIIGKKCFQVCAKRRRRCNDCIVSQCFKDGKIHEHQLTLPGDFVGRRFFQETVSVAAIRHQGRPKTVLAIFHDNTQKRALEAEAIRAGHLASIGELAAGVAHEINNPINSVINLAQIIHDNSEVDSMEIDVANRMIEEGTRIANIVSSLLAFSRDRKEYKTANDLNELISNTLALISAQLEKDGITLQVNIPMELPLFISHAQQVQQVFLNIINNARYALNRKYNGAYEDKKFKISGELVTIDQNEYIRIIFFDKGIGISEHTIDHIINPFFSTKPSGKGTGLGLSISHGIISDHNGKLKFESQEGEFTRVIVDLPVGEINVT